MSNNFVTLVLKSVIEKVNSLDFRTSQALFLNILAQTLDFMDGH